MEVASTASSPESIADRNGAPWAARLRAPLAVGIALFAVPALIAVIQDAWVYGNGAHLLFILGGAIWLLWDVLSDMPRRPAALAGTIALLAPVLMLYLVGRIAGSAWLAWMAVCAAGAVLIRDRFGWSGLARAAIPLALLSCMATPPLALIAPVSDGIIAATAWLAVELLWLAGVDAAIATPMFYVNQYELQLAEACAGLNTVFTLTVCMVLYAYLRHRGDWRRTLLLALFAIPVALLANLFRILLIALVIMTFGDAAGQGVAHELAGVTLFAIALLGLIAADELAGTMRR
jgi:exosortase